MNIHYIRSGDYFIPDLTLPEEIRPIGRWGRMHRDYLREHKPIQYNCLLLSGKLWTYLADLNEQAQDRLERMIDQMKVSAGISEALKASDPMAWVQRMNNIRARAEEIVRIKADFAELYQALNEMPLREMDWIIDPVCALCRDHERNGFVHGVQLGAQLVQEIQSV